MLSDLNGFSKMKLLPDLAQELGMIKFGFMAQALIGLIFQNLGAKDIKIKNNGHPDITFYYLGKKWKMEVEVMGKYSTNHTIKKEDLNATAGNNANEVGCIGLLDLNYPCRWYILNSPVVWKNGERSYALFELRNNSNVSISDACTHILGELTEKYKDIIAEKGYSGLVALINKK